MLKECNEERVEKISSNYIKSYLIITSYQKKIVPEVFRVYENRKNLILKYI